MKKLEKLLYEMVSINSANPDYSKHAAGEEEIGNYVYDYFKKNNIDCKKQNVAGKRSNIIAKIEGNKEKGNILFCSHLDTVYIEGMDFNPKVINGKMYGPGTADAKASMVAMMQALVEVKRKNRKIPTVYFAGVISEESMHLGIKKMLEEYNQFSVAMIGEPTNLNIGIAHKGCLRFRIKAIGKSGHGSEPDKGINAISFMAKFIER